MFDKHLFESITFHGEADLRQQLDLRATDDLEVVNIDIDIGARRAQVLWRRRDAQTPSTLAEILSLVPLPDPATTGIDMSDDYKIRAFNSIRAILRRDFLPPKIDMTRNAVWPLSGGPKLEDLD